jgi:hypothetical protein
MRQSISRQNPPLSAVFKKRTFGGAIGLSAKCQRRTSPHHSITSSARAINVGDKLMPSAFAVFKLTTSSNLVGCSIGKSAGSVPGRRIVTV